ncbi:uncharacterized protein LOC110858399 isoform X2 [Folsomia candida]|uniref:uncharacterized protein LOC110858399 isoform X2 n=1 Tax=Folsomia candida TaxID=158441 RepID=UPI000B8FA3E7|nr:uncharacterized protein LOC110858399 isoform X2 [Folsomia candida]
MRSKDRVILASFLCIGIFLVFVGGSHGSAIIEGGRRSVSELQDELELAEKFQTVTGIRDPKFISMLMMIRLQNNPCQAETGGNGTCYPRNQCQSLGGTSSGTCASGFGVCCTFQKSCNSETNQNVTYFVNPEWPGTFDGSVECPITVQKVDSNICQYRLDFEEFSLAQPEPVDHICESDVFVVAGGRPVPPICGENGGQHMYIDAGPSSGNIKINIVTSGDSFARRWRIKISQVQCNAQYRASDSCLQHHTGMSGRIKSFNYGDPQTVGPEFGMQLSAQEYSICIRAEEGFCGIVYVPCKDSAEPREAFVISSTSQNSSAPQRTMSGAEQCPSDWLGISCATDTGREMQTDGSSCVDRICGGTFTSLSGSTSHAPVYSFSRPFTVKVHFNDFEMSDPRAPDQMNRGFCLDYVQQSCPQSGKRSFD